MANVALRQMEGYAHLSDIRVNLLTVGPGYRYPGLMAARLADLN